MFPNKQPSSLRKAASKNSTKKLQQKLAGTHLDVPSNHGSRTGSRVGSRVASRANSDNEEGFGGDWNDAGSEYDVGGDDFEGGVANRGGMETSWEGQISEAVEDLNEKRSSTREDALSRLQTQLSQRFAYDAIDTKREEIMDLLKKSVKKGNSRENILACNVISLLFITVGEDDEKLFTDLAPLLQYTIKNHEDTEVKAACTYALATACFISSAPQPSHLPSYELMNFFADIAVTSGRSVNAEQNTETLTAALESFSALYAALFGELGAKKLMRQARRFFNKISQPVVQLLDHGSNEVRVASGETLALMLEILNDYQQQRDDGDVSDDEPPSETYNDDEDEDYEEITGDFVYQEQGQLVGVLNKLSTDSARHRSKKERSAGRSAFRDIVKSVEEGEKPHESLKMVTYDVAFDGWVELLQLHFLRDRLTSGFQTHFVHNTTIHSILPATAILYSPGSGGPPTSSLTSSGRDSKAGSSSQQGSRAGSRPSSSLGHYADAEDAKEALSRIDRKYLNAEMTKMRQVQRKKERGGGGGGRGYDDD